MWCRFLLTSLIALLSVSAYCPAQENASLGIAGVNNSDAAVAAPQFLSDQTEMPTYVGRHVPGKELHLFTQVKNPNDFELKFIGSQTSCYCTDASTENPTISPGGFTNVRAVVHTAGEEGNREVKYTLKFEGPGGKLFLFQKVLSFSVYKEVSWGAEVLSPWLIGAEGSKVTLYVSNYSSNKWSHPKAVVQSDKVDAIVEEILEPTENSPQKLKISLVRNGLDLDKSFSENSVIELREVYGDQKDMYAILSTCQLLLRQKPQFEIAPKQVFLPSDGADSRIKLILLNTNSTVNFSEKDTYKIKIHIGGKEVTSQIKDVSSSTRFAQIVLDATGVTDAISHDDEAELKIAIHSIDGEVVGAASTVLKKP